MGAPHINVGMFYESLISKMDTAVQAGNELFNDLAHSAA